MDEIVEYIHQILSQTVTLHMYSFPNFALEAFVAGAICIMYILLHLEVSKIAFKTLSLKPNTVYCKQLPETCSAESVCTSVTHYHQEYRKLNLQRKPSTPLTYRKFATTSSTHSQIGWTFPNHIPGDLNIRKVIDERKKNVLDIIISLTPTEYAKIDKVRKLRDKNMAKRLKSLTTLYTDALMNKHSETTFKRQVEMARENVEYSKMASDKCKASTSGITDSFLNLLESIARQDSPTMHFNGDITSFALEAGNLTPSRSSTCILEEDIEALDTLDKMRAAAGAKELEIQYGYHMPEYNDVIF